ncbi:MAG TPA: DUF6531 domain-containing protein [Burkholderiaceae bacterium]|nr:DUF6531 domain-containing protein [Burkholderiaceae bacterium]
MNNCKGVTRTGNLECTVKPQIIPDWQYQIPGPVRATPWLSSEDAAIAEYKSYIGNPNCGPVQHILGSFDSTWGGHASARFEFNTLWTRWRKPISFMWVQGPNCEYPSSASTYLYASRNPSCGPSWYGSLNDDPASAFCYRQAPQEVQTCGVGNPVLPQSGTKIEPAQDYRGVGQEALSFTRIYRSHWPPGVAASKLGWAANFVGGVGWRASYDRSIDTVPNTPANMRRAIRPDGAVRMFAKRADPQGVVRWMPEWGNLDTLEERLDAGGAQTGWRYRAWGEDTLELYDLAGRLQSVVSSDGSTLGIRYSDAATPPQQAPAPGYLIEVGNRFGRALQLNYDAQGRLVSFADPAGQLTQFGVGAAPGVRTDTVTYPDGEVRQYHYDEAAHLESGLAASYYLTGITDEIGERFATFKYNAQAMTASSEHAGGVYKYSFAYPRRGLTNVTTPLGGVNSLGWIDGPDGNSQISSVSQPGGSGCSPATQRQTYDANGNIASRLSFTYKLVCYKHDLARNLETTRVEGIYGVVATCPADIATYAIPTNLAADKPQIKVSTAWHPDWRLEVKRAEPKKLTTWVYNGQPDPSAGGALASCAPTDALLPDGKPIAVLCKRIEQATNDASGTQGFAAAVSGTARTWTWTYNRHGQVLSEDGPRTDLSDTTTYTYYADTGFDANGVGHTLGDLWTVTNAKGQVTEITQYDKHGHPLEIIDPNGLVTRMSYHVRGWLTGKSVGPAGGPRQQTDYDYDAAGQLKKVTHPDGSHLAYTYDGAHRLTDVTDSLGNAIHYTLDAMGNRIKEEVKDPNGTLVRSQRRVYDALNRVQNLVTPAQ